MEAVLTTLTFWFIAGLIVFILIIISIIGTWFEAREMRISTHTLTWSVTIALYNLVVDLKISTHTLTWSVTS